MLSGFAPVSTSRSLAIPAGARMLIAVRLNMYLCDWSGWADQKPGEKDWSFRRAARLPFVLFRSGAESKRSQGREGDGAIRGEMRRSPRIQDVCLMLFDTWADCLCQTWRESFNKEVPPQRLSEEAARGEKEAARPQEKERLRCRSQRCLCGKSCSTSINLFFISPPIPRRDVHLAMCDLSGAALRGRQRSLLLWLLRREINN